MKKKPSFADLLNSEKFIVSAELTPPVHYQLEDFMKQVEITNEYVDIIQINDHLLAKARITNLIAGQQCKVAGINPVLQVTLRHKNRIAIQGDLLGMAALGLNNINVLSGYPCRIGTDDNAKDVNDLETLEAIKKITTLSRDGELFNGEVIQPAPQFTIGTIEFPCGLDQIDKSMERLEQKIDAGAQFIQIQAVFEVETLAIWMKEVGKRNLHKRACFMGAIFPFNNHERVNVLKEIPGLNIPDKIINRVKKNNQEEESLQIMVELIHGIRNIEGIRGIHIRCIGIESWVPRIVEASGLGGELVY